MGLQVPSMSYMKPTGSLNPLKKKEDIIPQGEMKPLKRKMKYQLNLKVKFQIEKYQDLRKNLEQNLKIRKPQEIYGNV